MMLKKNLLSSICILLVLIHWIFSFTYNKRWTKNPIAADAVLYYDYLPALFIYKDIKLNFIDKDPQYFASKYWPITTPNGGRVIKTSMGMSIMYSPFFFIGHLCAKITGEKQDGYSTPYTVPLRIGVIFYLFLGFFFLRKFLLKYFKDIVASLTIITIYFGTNLLYFVNGEPLLAHAYLFSLSCIFIFLTDKWHDNPSIRISLLLGFIGGMLTIIRPTMILFVLFPLLYKITGIASLKEKLQFVKTNIWKLPIIVLAFFIPIIPQLIYWKYITGDLTFYSYPGETFFWDNPHIMDCFFSYRKGWLLYTPIMTFALAGFFFMKEKVKHVILPAIVLFVISAYIIVCWWCWWYGGGFGLRAFIDFYGLLAIPLSAFYDFILKRKIWIPILTMVVATLLAALNIFQEWQYENGLIHFDGMTKVAYKINFLKTENSGEFWGRLRQPNYSRAMAGLPEYFEDEENIYDIAKRFDFENVPFDKDSIYYSSTAANNSEHSYILKENADSPAISMQAADIIHGYPTEAIASVQFYFPELPADSEEHLLVIELKNDSAVYFSRSINLNVTRPDKNEWNTATLNLPIHKIIDWRDEFKTYVVNKNTTKEVLIDNLQFEIIRPKYR